MTATPIAGCLGGTGAVSVIGDHDIYRFEVVTPESSVFARVVQPPLVTCPDTWVTLRLFDSLGLELGQMNPGGTCPHISPLNSGFAANLPPGSYFIEVADLLNDATTPDYELVLDVMAPQCGDGTRQLAEECDDANVVSGDGCDSACLLEGNVCPEVESNGDIPTATPLEWCDAIAGALSSGSDVDVIEVEIVVPNSSMSVLTTKLDQSPCVGVGKLRLFDASGALIEDMHSYCNAANPQLYAFLRNLPPGPLYLEMSQGPARPPSAPYRVSIDVVPPSCGDGILQPGEGESCDDGNTSFGDGCDATCALESGACAEVEPNDGKATANPVDGCARVFGEHDSLSTDFFRVSLAEPGGSIWAQVATPDGNCAGTLKPRVRLWDASGPIAESPFAPAGTCRAIEPWKDPGAATLPVGVYYLQVLNSSPNQAPFALDFQVITPACGNRVVEPSEQCDDGNVDDNDECTNACIIPCAPGEIRVELTAPNLPLDLMPGLQTFVTIDQPTPGIVTKIAMRLTKSGYHETRLRPPGFPNAYALSSGGILENATFSTAASEPAPFTQPTTGVWLPGAVIPLGFEGSGTWTFSTFQVNPGPGTLQDATLIVCLQ